MKVVIIGAGLGGLSAAYALSKSGHDVVLFERNHQLNPTGGGISIRPNARRIIETWNIDQDLQQICDSSKSVVYRDLQSGDIKHLLGDSPQLADLGTTRRAMIKLLYLNASRAGAKIQFKTTVVQVSDNTDFATVTLDSGESVSSDIVLAADGIKSRIRSIILSDLGPHENWEPLLDQTTFYTIDLPSHAFTDDPSSTKLLENSEITTWMGDGGFVITRYSSKFKRVGLLFAIQEDTDQKDLWDENGDIKHVSKFFAGSYVDITRSLQLATRCDRWRVAELPNLPRWSSRAGRIVLLGDSAHAMHPNAAQGFSTIIEDIGVLDYILSEPGRSLSVPQMVSAWQTICKPRAERVKAFARWNTQYFSEGKSADSTHTRRMDSQIQHEGVVPNMAAHFSTPEFHKWNFDYDAIDKAKELISRKDFAKL